MNQKKDGTPRGWMHLGSRSAMLFAAIIKAMECGDHDLVADLEKELEEVEDGSTE